MTDTKSIHYALEQGREAHRAGDLVTARETYTALLSVEPDNADVLHALGNLDLQQGLLEQAEIRLREAVRINRYGVGFQHSLGNLLVAQEKFRDAETAYFEELRMRPDFAIAHAELGNLMMRIGNYKRAVKHYQSAVQFAPESAVAVNHLGRALMEVGEHARADDSFRRALHLQPDFAEPQAYLGLLKLAAGELQDAHERFVMALELDPDCAVAYKGIGHLGTRQGKRGEALAAYQKVVELDGTDVEAELALAEIWHHQGAWEKALIHYHRARELAPGNVDLLNDYAALLMERGELAGAAENYERALQIRPSDQRSLIGYGTLKAKSGDTKIALSKLSSVVQSGRATTELLGVYTLLLGRAGRGREGIAMLEQRLRKKMPKAEKYRLHFTLGKLLHADSSYDLAFHHFRIANEINRKVFDQHKYLQTCDAIISAFNADNLASAARAQELSQNLVFAVGMPGSGLRTIERLIANHEQVLDIGAVIAIELLAYRLSAEANGPWPFRADLPTSELLNKYAQSYLDQLRAKVTLGDNLILDATWRNFLYVGVIELLFPGARIIYCTRDDRDVALSTFFNDLQAQPGLSYASNMQDIAVFINGHKRVMAHWKKTSRLPLHVVSYERMILDYDEEVAALLDFLGIADPDAETPVSAKQKLPKPSFLKSTSLRKFRHYRVHLEGLVEALETPPDRVF